MTRLIDADAIPWFVEGVGEIPVITKEEIDDMPTACRSNCLECDLYNHEKQYCPKFCDVIREAVKDIRKDSIPVSFIEELIQISEKVGAEKYAEYLGYLLDDWAERKTND